MGREKMSKSMWKWVPNKSLGPVHFGEDIEIYIRSLEAVLNVDISGDETGWITYNLPNNNASIDVENGFVVCTTNYEECIYEGKNIIGMSPNQLSEILDCQPDETGSAVIYDDDDIQTPYEYNGLGLLVWSRDNVIICASCSDDTDE